MANYNTPANAFKPGNKLGRKAAHTGRPRRFAHPEDLWKAACLYFEECVTSYIPHTHLRNGKVVTLYRAVPMSVKELCTHIGIAYLDHYKRNPVYKPTVTRIQYVIYQYNFTRAAAGLLRYRNQSVARILRKNREPEAIPAINRLPFASSPIKTPHFGPTIRSSHKMQPPISTGINKKDNKLFTVHNAYKTISLPHRENIPYAGINIIDPKT